MNKAYWKIEKEWISDWGLTATEALVLADIIAWPEASHSERAERVNLSARQLTRVKDILSSNDRTKCLLPLGQNVLKKRTKWLKVEDKMSSSPHTPHNKEEEHEELGESAHARTREESSKKNEPLDTKKNDEKNSPSPNPSPSEIILSGIRDFYESYLHAVYLPDFRIETSATRELADKLSLVMKQEQWLTDLDSIRTFWLDFLRQAYQSADTWQRNHFDIRTLNSQFNNFYLKIKNGNSNDNGSANNGITRDYLEKTLREAAGIL